MRPARTTAELLRREQDAAAKRDAELLARMVGSDQPREKD